MTTTKNTRPDLRRRVTRGTEQERKAREEAGLAITIDVDGKLERYEVRLGDVTSEAAAELRRQTGYGVNSLIQAVASDPDVDYIAAFVFLARMLRGDEVELADCSVRYAQLLGEGFDLEALGGEDAEEGAGPLDPEG